MDKSSRKYGVEVWLLNSCWPKTRLAAQACVREGEQSHYVGRRMDRYDRFTAAGYGTGSRPSSEMISLRVRELAMLVVWALSMEGTPRARQHVHFTCVETSKGREERLLFAVLGLGF